MENSARLFQLGKKPERTAKLHTSATAQKIAENNLEMSFKKKKKKSLHLNNHVKSKTDVWISQ